MYNTVQMLIAGLTGNFGMGKSYVLSVFRDLGAVTLDSDRIVSLLLNEGGVVGRIRDLLGDDVIGIDGGLDRKAVARIIFGDASLKKRLEEMLHPLVFEKIADFIGKLKDNNRIVIVEVPLLFEGAYQGRFEKVITVHAPQETAIDRLMRSGFSREEAMARLKAQLPIEIKKERADYVIDNGGTKEETRKQVEAVYRSLDEEMKK